MYSMIYVLAHFRQDMITDFVTQCESPFEQADPNLYLMCW